MRVGWRERGERLSWDVSYTTIGGRFDFDPIGLMPEEVKTSAERAISQVVVAATPSADAMPDQISFWATVVRKIVQRGTRPVIHHADRSHFRVGNPSAEQVVAAIVGPTNQAWTLEPSIELHPTYELPFWELLGEQCSPLRRWLTPQAWFEGLVGQGDTTSERWVDFLLYRPWYNASAVLELDGSGHETTGPADQQRDRLLRSAGHDIRRMEGSNWLDVDHPELLKLQALVNRPWLGTADPSLVTAVHGAASIHRFAFALAEAVDRGFLGPAREWRLNLRDTTDAAERQPNIAFDLLESVAAAWDLDIVPERIAVNGRVFERREDGRYTHHGEQTTEPPHVEVVLDPFTPAHAALPTALMPTIVIRGCLLPVDLAWAAPTSLTRMNRTGTSRALAALDRLLQDLYGYQGYREGQREAISRLLSGGDALVLLPTGAGKTLVYQVAGLLRPGVTLVISPLRALIDDQERRMRELGIDRVVGLHSGKALSKGDRRRIQTSVGQGEAIVVLVAPERLQIEDFRRQLGSAASGHLVNLAVVDEAHCVSEWGHQFRTSYLRLGRNLRRLCADLEDQPPPLLALTATASPRVLGDMKWELGLDEDDPGLTYRPDNFDRPNLNYIVIAAPTGQRTQAVQRALEWVAEQLGVPRTELALSRGPETASGIVFVPHSRSGLDLGIDTFTSVAKSVLEVDDRLIAQYAGQPPNDSIGGAKWEQLKAANADEFRGNDRPLMISTNAFGMGIDKPNIRYTVHVALPSSIEAFAQESGRAGRDQRESFCALVATDDVDGGITRIEHNVQPPRFAKEDVDLQLGFLRTGFGSPATERAATAQVAQELLESAGAGSQATIPKGGDDREKALFRLLMIGLVDDYTIEYGSDTFTVYLSYFTEASLRSTTADFVRRAAGGNAAAVRRVEAANGSTIHELVDELSNVLVETIYERVEPARRRALSEVLQLSSLGRDGAAIRERINAYLTEGPVAALLDKAVREQVGLLETLNELDQVPPDRLEWTGAAARYLESFPDHPLLLAVRALGEAWRIDGSRDEFRRLLEGLARALPEFGLESHESADIVLRVLEMLRTYFDGERWAWCTDVWDVLDGIGLDDDDLRRVENLVFEQAATGEFHILEVRRVIRRRTSGAALAGEKLIRHHTTQLELQ